VGIRRTLLVLDDARGCIAGGLSGRYAFFVD
jgi:hypothetical protein